MDTEGDEEEDMGQFINKGIIFTQKDVMCNLQEKVGIPSSWILLDIQSTLDVFCNQK